MAIEIMSRVWKHANVSSGELIVLLSISDFSNDKQGYAWPSVDTLAKKSRLSMRHTQRIIRSLERKGLLKIETKSGPHGVNLYTVVMPEGVTCTSSRQDVRMTPASPGGDMGVTQTVIEPLLIQTYKESSSKPSEQQVIEYGKDIGLPKDECLKFIDHYQSNGWKVGNNPMKDWRAAVRNWKRNYEKGNYAKEYVRDSKSSGGKDNRKPDYSKGF